MTSWQELRRQAAGCTRCDLYRRATQTVFGEGPTSAAIALLGEQPGDQEDKQGHAFVGPAGRILDRALEEAGISRADVYMTNAVKHFKWTERAFLAIGIAFFLGTGQAGDPGSDVSEHGHARPATHRAAAKPPDGGARPASQ